MRKDSNLFKIRYEINEQLKKSASANRYNRVLGRKPNRPKHQEMPEITEIKKLIETYKLMHNRTTPYQMGTRNYSKNDTGTIDHPEENIGWKDYVTLRDQVDKKVESIKEEEPIKVQKQFCFLTHKED